MCASCNPPCSLQVGDVRLESDVQKQVVVTRWRGSGRWDLVREFERGLLMR
jgi:hypothetical protein